MYEANNDAIKKYTDLVHINLGTVPLIQDGLLCTKMFCKVHSQQMNVMHVNIMLALLDTYAYEVILTVVNQSVKDCFCLIQFVRLVFI